MSNKVKTVLYWVSILPPVWRAICGVVNYAYKAYMNTLMEIEQKKQNEEFNQTWKELQ